MADCHHMERNDSGDSPSRRTRREMLAAAGALGASIAAGCIGDDDSGTDASGDGTGSSGASGGGRDGTDETGSGSMESATVTPTGDETPASAPETTEPSVSGADPTPVGNTDWRAIELETVRGGETFTVDEFEKPVVLETFAVWCPKCTRQQRKLRGVDDAAVKVSLNTDPNEAAEQVRSHANDNDFDWRYAVAPAEMTQSLVDAFGTTVTNAPSTPVIVACPGGGASFFAGSGQTDAPTIEATARNC